MLINYEDHMVVSKQHMGWWLSASSAEAVQVTDQCAL